MKTIKQIRSNKTFDIDDDLLKNTEHKQPNKWIPREEYLLKKKQEKERMTEARKKMNDTKFVKNLVDSIMINVIKKIEEEKNTQIRQTKYIRPRIRFSNGKRLLIELNF